jgi:hypothetical protein
LTSGRGRERIFWAYRPNGLTLRVITDADRSAPCRGFVVDPEQGYRHIQQRWLQHRE